MEVSDQNWKGRAIAAVIFLIIGLTALAFAYNALIATEKGWQDIEVNSSAAAYAESFVLSYELGASDLSARAENRAITAIYSDALLKAGQALDVDTASEGNLRVLNDSPNAVLELDSVLYEALELLVSRGDRTMFLGPALGIYENIFFLDEDWRLNDFDPERNEELRELFSRIAAYAADENSVSLELLGDNKARLVVSDEYLRFLEDEELDPIVDLGWMKNAFVVDHVADRLTAEGHTRGALSSDDGFCRNLGGGGERFSLNVFARQNGKAVVACRLDYTGPASLVTYRAFPLSDSESLYYYVTDEGEVKTRYLSPDDALPHAAADSLTVLSKTLSCAETMTRSSSLFIQGVLGVESLAALAGSGMDAILPEGGTIWATSPELDLQNVYTDWTIETVN